MHGTGANVEDALGECRCWNVQRFDNGLGNVFDVSVVATHISTCSEARRKFAHAILYHGFDVHGVAHAMAVDGRVTQGYEIDSITAVVGKAGNLCCRFRGSIRP